MEKPFAICSGIMANEGRRSGGRLSIASWKRAADSGDETRAAFLRARASSDPGRLGWRGGGVRPLVLRGTGLEVGVWSVRLIAV